MGEPRGTGDLETSLSGREILTCSARLGPPTYLQPQGLGPTCVGELTPLLPPGTGVPPLSLLPRGSPGPGPWLRCPAAPTSLRLQLPVVGDPGAGVRFHQEGARHSSSRARVALVSRGAPVRSAAAGAARVRLISIAHRLGQPASGAAGAGRGGAAGPGFGATPKTGARRWGGSAWLACPAHGTSLARAESHADPWGLAHPLASD